MVIFQLIEVNIFQHCKITELNKNDYVSVLKIAKTHSLRGGIIYDALHLKAAKKEKAKAILTLNIKDFERLSPLFHVSICHPKEIKHLHKK